MTSDATPPADIAHSDRSVTIGEAVDAIIRAAALHGCDARAIHINAPSRSAIEVQLYRRPGSPEMASRDAGLAVLGTLGCGDVHEPDGSFRIGDGRAVTLVGYSPLGAFRVMCAAPTPACTCGR